METINQLSTINHILAIKQQNSQLCLKVIQNYQFSTQGIRNISQQLQHQATETFKEMNHRVQEQLQRRLIMKLKRINDNRMEARDQEGINRRVDSHCDRILLDKEKAMEITKQAQRHQRQSSSLSAQKTDRLSFNKNIVLPNGSILLSRGEQKWLLFTCFLCIKYPTNKDGFIFDEKAKYVKHLQEHHMAAEFQVMIRSFPKHIPFSHGFYQGKFMKMSRDTKIDLLIQNIYSLQQMDKEDLYVCNCLNMKSFDKDNKDLPIYHRDLDYYYHLHDEHNGQFVKGSTHVIRNMNKRKEESSVRFKIIKFNSLFLTQEQIDQCLTQLVKQLRKRVNSKYNKYLLFSPLNSLYFFSNHPTQLPHNFYKGYPQSFPHILGNSINSHKTMKDAKSNNKRTVPGKSDGFSFEDYVKQEQKVSVHNKREGMQLALRLSKVQLSIINPRIFVCGFCRQIMYKEQQYLVHIHCQHDQFHDLNTHRLTFLHELSPQTQSTATS